MQLDLSGFYGHRKPRQAVTDGARVGRGPRHAARGRHGRRRLGKPQIGVASSWNEITPCNLSLDRLAKKAKIGVRAAGGFPLEFGTISVSTASRWATRACTTRWCRREVIADSVETVMQAERLDGSCCSPAATSPSPAC
jgi:dihydroxy-acid dehydratase